MHNGVGLLPVAGRQACDSMNMRYHPGAVRTSIRFERKTQFVFFVEKYGGSSQATPSNALLAGLMVDPLTMHTTNTRSWK